MMLLVLQGWDADNDWLQILIVASSAPDPTESILPSDGRPRLGQLALKCCAESRFYLRSLLILLLWSCLRCGTDLFRW
jgi:hypothetical protein